MGSDEQMTTPNEDGRETAAPPEESAVGEQQDQERDQERELVDPDQAAVGDEREQNDPVDDGGAEGVEEAEDAEEAEVEQTSFDAITDDESVDGASPFENDPDIEDEDEQFDPVLNESGDPAEPDDERDVEDQQDEQDEQDEQISSDYAARVLDATFVSEVLDEPVIDEQRYVRYITVPEDRPETVDDLDESDVDSFVQRLTPDSEDLRGLLDHKLPVEPVGPNSLTAINNGEDSLRTLLSDYEAEFDGIGGYTVDPEVVRQGIIDGKIPSLAQLLVLRKTARSKRAQAVDAVREMEAKRVLDKRTWAANYLAQLREVFRRASDEYDAANPALTEEQRTAFFTDIENEARALEDEADTHLIEAARREMCDVVLEADPDNSTAKALRRYVSTRQDKIGYVKRAVVLDENYYSGSPATAAAAPQQSPAAAPSEDDDPYQKLNAVPSLDEQERDETDDLDDLDGDESNLDDQDGESDQEDEADEKDKGAGAGAADDDPFAGIEMTTRKRTKKRKKKPSVAALSRFDSEDSEDDAESGDDIDSGRHTASSMMTKFLPGSKKDKSGSKKSAGSSAVASKEGEAEGDPSAVKRMQQWVSQHKLISSAAGVLAVGVIVAGAATVSSASHSGNESAAVATASASSSTGNDVQSKFSVGDKLDVVSDGKIVPVTVAEFNESGAIAQDSDGNKYLVTNDQLSEWINDHPENFADDNASASPSSSEKGK